MSKGSAFEREVCRILSFWVSDGKRDDIFYRSQASGARFTARRKSGKDTAFQGGDVCFSDPEGYLLCSNWSIEIKTGQGWKTRVRDENGKIVKKLQERWDVMDVIDSHQKKTTLEIMWEQCERDAGLTSREPILIFRRNLRSPCIMIKREYYNRLAEYYGEFPGDVIVLSGPQRYAMIIMLLKNFTEWIPDVSLFLNQKGRPKLKRRQS